MYRPGVALRDLGVPEEDEEEEEDGSGGGMKGLRSVLVAQVDLSYLLNLSLFSRVSATNPTPFSHVPFISLH